MADGHVCRPAAGEIAYDKDLVSTQEQTQDGALKKLYDGYQHGIVKKRKMLHMCHTVGHKIMPSIAIWFVISYWMAGLFAFNMVETEFSLIVQAVFTIVFFGGLYALNAFLAFRKKK